jgi:succinoglycan biosynthesis transport protein ExoP
MQSSVDQDTDSINVIKYLVLLWHWAWLIVLVVIIAAGGTYIVSKLIPPVYQARTTVLIDMAPSNQSIDYSSVLLSSQLTQTYAQMLTKTTILSEVATRLGLEKLDPKIITVKSVTNTQLINIFAESSDPKLATDIANTMVSVFADQVETLQSTRFSASEQSLQSQMTDIENKIKVANDQLTVTTDLTERGRLETTIANYNQTYASLLLSYEQVRLAEAQSYSNIVQIEPATIPIEPVRPNIPLNLAIAVLFSAVLVVTLIISIDLLNDSVKTPEEIKEKLGLPVLGVISHYRHVDGVTIAESQPLSPVAEAYRTLRTNLKYAVAGANKPLRSLMIISALPSEGKTDVVVNLGVVLAQNQQRVLLVDADLRRPSLHRRLGLDNLIGLCQIFVHPDLGIDYSFQPTRVNGLSIISSGDSPPNPSELLGSQSMESILEELKTNYDIVLIDTPPALAVTDAAAMLPFIDGVLLVVKPGSTHLAPLRRLIEQFNQFDTKLLGVVLNDINLRSSAYGFYYKHYRYYNDHRNTDGSKRAMGKTSIQNKWFVRVKKEKKLFQ